MHGCYSHLLQLIVVYKLIGVGSINSLFIYFSIYACSTIQDKEYPGDDRPGFLMHFLNDWPL